MARPKRNAPAKTQSVNRAKRAKTGPVAESLAQDTQNTGKSTEVKAEKVSETVKNTEIEEKENAKDENEEDEEEYDENEDDDYDPSKKAEANEDESEDSEGEQPPDYSAITTDVSQVRTRGQKFKESTETGGAKSHLRGLVEDLSRVDVDAIFETLQTTAADEWAQIVHKDSGKTGESGKTGQNIGIGSVKEAAETSEEPTDAEQQIRIFTTYTFAGKLVREEKTVAANSAEAKAYLNSTNGLASQEQDAGPRKSYVTVVRKVAGCEEEKPLRIKLKRPSLIDKFLAGDKKNKLSTLEKSRLDWASFVDKKKLKDDLAIHNKGGYLEKQDFLGRMEAKRDDQYQQARERDRQRQWQQQQQQVQRP